MNEMQIKLLIFSCSNMMFCVTDELKRHPAVASGYRLSSKRVKDFQPVFQHRFLVELLLSVRKVGG